MKIGILTLPLSTNYGGILQAWALQQVLRGMGHEPEIIHFIRKFKVGYKIYFDRCISVLLCIFRRFFLGKKQYRICYPFAVYYSPVIPEYIDSGFINCINKTEKIYVSPDDASFPGSLDYDAFLVGSDQVWREGYSPRIESYFFDFMMDTDRRKRIAYAASFGVEEGFISEGKIGRCSQLLARFDAVSVRENGGLRIAREVMGRKDAVKVLDPTLLLSAADYEPLIPDSASESGYVMAYILDESDEKSGILSHVSSRREAPAKQVMILEDVGYCPSVGEWLGGFANADFVVTDSFHGCVFSIIFRKPFVAIANAGRGLDRFTSLLDTLGLSSRLVHSLEEFEARRSELDAPVDYDKVYSLLDSQREKSLDFLRNALA